MWARLYIMVNTRRCKKACPRLAVIIALIFRASANNRSDDQSYFTNKIATIRITDVLLRNEIAAVGRYAVSASVSPVSGDNSFWYNKFRSTRRFDASSIGEIYGLDVERSFAHTGHWWLRNNKKYSRLSCKNFNALESFSRIKLLHDHGAATFVMKVLPCEPLDWR
jgi:hypothetical protein